MKAHFHLKATLFHIQEEARTKKMLSRQQSLNFREALHKRVECVYAEPSRKYAETARQVMKLETESRGGRRLKAAKVLSAARVGLNDEAFFMVGSDEALARMMRREKAKVFSKVNLRNPLLIELPDQLLIYEGQSYVARIFIGLTAHELEEGVDIAFAPRIDDSHHSSILSDHDYIRRVQQQQANVVPRWEHPIIRS
uniref:tRNA-synt_2 domain-containing protein n=1 Tax=Globodera pallida TaxID=36090 RepID=A0A183CQQ4_GLOPA